jgi:uncharacterized protein YndB with AHSA1/START domain
MAQIKHLLVIDTPAEKVYRAVTKQDGLAGWWTTEVKTEPKVNENAEFKFGDVYFCKMKITNLKPNKKVEWECIDGDEEWIGTQITFALSEEDGKTTLSFAHSDWGEMTDFFASCNYNWGWYLTSLKDYCEKGKGKPFAADQTK